tara:strand:- start:220 stop:615 length:396 start_codon:yes stop_codon:yes gene_type:complete
MLFTFTFTFTFTQGKRELRQNLKACEQALQQCYCTNERIVDTIVIYKGKQAVKINKQNQKTARQENVQNTKVVKNDNKTEVKTDKFLNFMQGLTRITALLVAGGFMGGGVLITKLLQLLKSNTKAFSWLPI